ncbi:hypothetical protein DFH07DRAFT_780747 [Mycena maculata]|uniref:Uncharacterized protein n=1 Tax=Mycena maculata TaxID=230809 RepID=A0AAD7I199_9AGAR|nr:hypothetical protein DFH07DRAFT_780747 [Mycena maculata]
MPVTISFQETHRLFGPSNRPDFKTNVRHRAILRKALELYPPEELQAVFGQPIRLRVVMGSALTFSQLGKIQTNFVHNNCLVSRETLAPDLEARDALRAYRNTYEAYFMMRGNEYAVRNPQAKPRLQAAEQAWHDWIVPYLAARGTPGRPAWALQPLPGLQRVHVLPALAPAAAPSTLQTPRRRHALLALPTPPPSSPARNVPKKRKFLGVIDISDSEEEEALRPRKKMKFLGVVDLTI